MIDYHTIPSSQQEVHDRLTNWARWCLMGSNRREVHPMFREYRNSYDQAKGGGIPVDVNAAMSTQKAFISLPEKHRWALNWFYIRPYIPVYRVRQALEVTSDGLARLLVDGRTLMRNIA